MEIIKADLAKACEAEAFLALTGHYMADAMGGAAPWTERQKIKVIRDLLKHPACFILLAREDSEFVGVCTCFYAYSTFLASDLYNIHDMYVLPGYRGRGIGRELLRMVEEIAKERGVAKLTLEVRSDNGPAKHLYRDEGYGESQPAMLFWSKYL